MHLLLVAFLVACIFTLAIVRLARTHACWLNDHGNGPQKFHAVAVPRVGGVGIFAAVALPILMLRWKNPLLGGPALSLLSCALPAFCAGIAEDVTRRVSPGRRLLFTSLSAFLSYALLDAAIRRTGIVGLDWVVSTSLGAVMISILAVAGVSNAVNLIDGFNGLASLCVMLMLAGLAFVAFKIEDPLVSVLALIGVGAVMGFFVWNYPHGLIFLGDGGAYFLGFYLAELCILLLARNSQVSPLFPLALVWYPVFETLFSMYRRKWLQGRPVSRPDGLHLHSLIYRRIWRYKAGKPTPRELTRRNSQTSPCLWLLCSLCVVPAMAWWDNTALLVATLAAFSLLYATLYWRIVRFKRPRWKPLHGSRQTAVLRPKPVGRHPSEP